MLRKVKNHALSLSILFGALSNSAEAAGMLNVFQITQGYNNGPLVPHGIDNADYFGFAFHNGKMAACWMDNSGDITSTPPAPVANIVFGSVQIHSPHDVTVGPNIVVSKNLGVYQVNPELAIDPKNTNNITIASVNYPEPRPPGQHSYGVLVVSTTDGGKTWTTNSSLLKNNFQQDSKLPIPLGFDQSNCRISYDSKGNLILAYLSCFSPDDAHLTTAEFPFFMYLCVSTDHGKSFKAVQKFDPRVFGAISYEFELLAIGQDQIAVAPGTYGSSPPVFTPVGGQLFIFPIEAKGEIGSPTHMTFPDGMLYANGSGSMSFSPAGGLLIAQSSSETNSTQSCGFLFTSFIPKGAKEFPAATAFQPFKNVSVGGSAFYPPQPDSGTTNQTKIAYVYNGHHYGRVYMAYIDNSNVPSNTSCTYGVSCPGYPFSSPICSTAPNWANTNVFVVYSDNDGKTWSTPFAIPKTNANTRIMPHIAIDQTNGNIGVAWLDAVNDPANVKVQVFATVIPWDFFD